LLQPVNPFMALFFMFHLQMSDKFIDIANKFCASSFLSGQKLLKPLHPLFSIRF